MLPEPAVPVDWTSFGHERPRGWVAIFDSRHLVVNGRSAFGLESLSESSHWATFFDGLLYNRDQLQHELAIDRHEMPSNAELLGLAYEKWGSEVIAHLQGIFSLIIWDKLSETLIAARDRIGIFPLFYATQSGTWYFSTSLDLLAETPDIGATLNCSLLVSWIALVWPIHDETPYSEIRRVRNGYQLVITGDNAIVEQYWNVVQRVESQGWVREDEVGHIDELIGSSVSRFLALGESAIYLSGGLDSVSVAVFTASESEVLNIRPPLALSVEFPGQDIDESSIQQSVAHQLGLPQYLFPLHNLVGSQGLVSESLDLCSSFPEPSINLWRPIYGRLGFMAVKDGRGVLLTGAGGDEWLGVTPTYAADLMLSGDIAGLSSLLATYYRSFPLSFFATLRNVLWRSGLRPLVGDMAARGAATVAPGWLRSRQMRHWRMKFPSWLASTPELQTAIDERLNGMLDALQRTRWSTSPYLRELAEGIDHILIAMDMENLYDEGRKFGAPILSPFLDAEVIEFLARTPPELLNAGGRAKGLVRGTLARRFPDQGFDRQKKLNLGSFFDNTLFPGAMEAWGEMGGARTLEALGVVDGRRIDQPIRELQTGEHSLVEKWQFMYLVYLERWVRSHIALI